VHFLKTYFFSSAKSYELEDILDISDDIFGLGNDDSEDDEVQFVSSDIFGDEPRPRNDLEMEEFRKEDDSVRRRSERLGKKPSQHFGFPDEDSEVVGKMASDDKSKGRKRKSLKRKSGDNVDTSTKVRQTSEKSVDKEESSSEESESSNRVKVPTGKK
jgi:hypothetical protein